MCTRNALPLPAILTAQRTYEVVYCQAGKGSTPCVADASWGVTAFSFILSVLFFYRSILPTTRAQTFVAAVAVVDTCRLACRVARAYTARVEGGASVHEADAGSEPVGLLDCFIG